MGEFIGQPLPRFEDERFITGAGNFTDDIVHGEQATAVMVRSPHAHAEIVAIETDAARSATGVLGVYTSADLLAAGICEISSFTRTPPYQMFNADGSEMPDASQYPLARERVRYSGESVAVVVAETPAAARDAADLVSVEYRVLPAVPSIDTALSDDAEIIWPELGGNRSCHWETGDEGAVAALFEGAAHVVETTVSFPRRIIAFMEPRAAVARYDAEGGRYTLQAGCQCAHWMQDGLALVLNVAKDSVRVIVPDTGGGFGTRAIVYPEFVCALFAARTLGRPVRWTAERSESFVSDAHARSQRTRAQLALDGAGNFMAIRAEVTWCHGGYIAPRSVFVVLAAMPPMICGPYRFKAQHFLLEGVFSNTTPIASFRGVGRSEAGYVLERLVEAAAHKLGVDATGLRRQNLIAPGDMPYASAAGLEYERAFFEDNLDIALDAADAENFAGRQAHAKANNLLRGFAVSPYIITSGGVPDEFAAVEMDGAGGVVVHTGTQDFGMGHETVFAQVAGELLGTDPGNIRVVFGDTDKVPYGQGGHGSRCMRIGGSTIAKACETLIAKARDLAGDALEVSPRDLVYRSGEFTVEGTDRRISLADVAAKAEVAGTPLTVSDTYEASGPGFPNGAHAVEVEIDPDTGTVTLVNVVSVVDPGRVINPMLVEGQLHGGVVQGIGEAMHERVVYDADSAQLLSGSFLDFTLPRADDLPDITTRLEPQFSDANPLGVKGVGEMGTMVIQAVVANAVLDALSVYGVSEIDIPVTSEGVWRAIREAQGTSTPYA